MSRPLRIDFPRAVLHVTLRGDRREPIFEDDTDRAALLNVLGQGMQRFDAQLLAYGQVGNQYHSVLHTHQTKLSLWMRHLNGVYTQAFNRRHGTVGHLFHGRSKAILVDRDTWGLLTRREQALAGVTGGPADFARAGGSGGRHSPGLCASSGLRL
jgi:REP element-mobilizing transposase RayT